jgi:hypothetical protein
MKSDNLIVEKSTPAATCRLQSVKASPLYRMFPSVSQSFTRGEDPGDSIRVIDFFNQV